MDSQKQEPPLSLPLTPQIREPLGTRAQQHTHTRAREEAFLSTLSPLRQNRPLLFGRIKTNPLAPLLLLLLLPLLPLSKRAAPGLRLDDCARRCARTEAGVRGPPCPGTQDQRAREKEGGTQGRMVSGGQARDERAGERASGSARASAAAAADDSDGDIAPLASLGPAPPSFLLAAWRGAIRTKAIECTSRATSGFFVISPITPPKHDAAAAPTEKQKHKNRTASRGRRRTRSRSCAR